MFFFQQLIHTKTVLLEIECISFKENCSYLNALSIFGKELTLWTAAWEKGIGKNLNVPANTVFQNV